jgi:hypothetical protein
MYKMWLVLLMTVAMVAPLCVEAEEVSVPHVVPDPRLTTMRITSEGEVTQLEFADGSEIENPEVSIETLRNVDLLEIYNIPFDLWHLETEEGLFWPTRSPASRGLVFATEGDYVIYLNENEQPNKVTDAEGNELAVKEDYLASLDGGRANILGYRAFTMIEYRTSPDGEVQRRILKTAAQ